MPKIVDHDEYKKELLEKCFRLFSRKGYSSVTMREIASEIGVSTGSLYHYFPSKESILGEMIIWAGESNTSEYIRRTGSTDNIRERYRLNVEFWKEHGEYYQNLMLLGIDMLRVDGRERFEAIFHEFSEYYVVAMSDRLKISRQFARSIFLYLIGVVLHSLLTPSFFSYEEQVDVFSGMLEPLVVDTSENMDLALSKAKGIIISLLMNNTALSRQTESSPERG